jgi:hypothetical protein
MVFARTALLVSIALVVAACSSPSSPDSSTTESDGSYVILSQGGTNEGHTPTAFAGTGTGLFAGDNLNSSFPEGVGVQLYLTFDVPAGTDVNSALIRSDALHVAGTPFEDLGPLLAEPVRYGAFGPDLFDLEATGRATVCSIIGDTSIECDVTETVDIAVNQGASTAQFRIRFDTEADNDGQQDLAMFFRKNSNTNESGIFELVVTPDG